MSQSFTYIFQDGTVPVDIVVGVASPPTNSTGYGTSYSVTSIGGIIGGSLITGEVGTGGAVQTSPTTFDNAIFTASSGGVTTGAHTGSLDGIDYSGLLFQTATATYNLYFDSVSDNFLLTNESTSKTDVLTLQQTNAPCYCPGTLLLTDRGEVAVEALSIGDVLVTAAGRHRPVRWIGRRGYSGRFLAANPQVQPVRFRAGSLGEGLPRRDLLVSPDHAMFLDGVLIPAHCLVNGTTVVRERGLPRVEYIHVELDTHDVILAEGAPSESFLNDDSRALFHNAVQHDAAQHDATQHDVTQHDASGPGAALAVTFCAPRLDNGPALDAARRRLAETAGTFALAA